MAETMVNWGLDTVFGMVGHSNLGLADAFRRAEEDDAVRVVILGGEGKMFSAGHDMGSKVSMEEWASHPTRAMNGGTREGSEGLMLQEWHYFFQNTLRWRNLRKITIAQVHGPTYAAGLMLVWACDLIVAAEGATDDAQAPCDVGLALPISDLAKDRERPPVVFLGLL